MLTKNSSESPDPPKKDSVSEIVESQWYDSQKIINLTTQERESQCLKYVFLSSQGNPYREFMNQFHQLIRLRDELKSVIYFISFQPGETLTQHFVFGIILDRNLIIVNPMGKIIQAEFYKVIFKIKEDLKWIDSIYISATQIQRDEEAIVSCGPICVELLNFFISLSQEKLQDLMSQGEPAEKELTYSTEEMSVYKLKHVKTVAQKEQGKQKEGEDIQVTPSYKNTLSYKKIYISGVLPESLKNLLDCEPKTYLERLEAIRQRHTSSLPEKGKGIHPPEQQLVFKMIGEKDFKFENEFLQLKEKFKSRNLSAREVKEELEVKSAEEEFYQHEDKRRAETQIKEVFNTRWDRTSELQSDRCRLRLTTSKIGDFEDEIKKINEIIITKGDDDHVKIFYKNKHNDEVKDFVCSSNLGYTILASLPFDGSVLPKKGNSEIYKQVYDEVTRQGGYIRRDNNKWKRRLDSIARLIEGNSTCAAIALEGDSFLIATNKNFIVGSEAQGYILIDTVMSFLKNVAENKYNDNQDTYQQNFEKTFRKICTEAITSLQFLAYIRDELVKDSFVEHVMQAAKQKEADFRELRDYLSEKIELGHCPSSPGSAFAVCVALMKDFNKVVKFINDNKAKTDFSPTARFIKAIKNYKKTNIVNNDTLRDKVNDPDKREKMHAEMRILVLIDDQLKNKSLCYYNYIGISKLCCLDCHAIIYAVNHADGYKNSIEIRGAHNVEHTGNWSAPFGITGNPSSKLEPPKVSQGGGKTTRTSPPEPFAAAVVEQFIVARKQAGSFMKTKEIKAAGASEVSEYPNLSQTSDDEGEDYYTKYCSYLFFMEKSLRMRKEIYPSGDFSQEIAMLNIGLKIYENQAFKNICNTEFANLEKRAKDFGMGEFGTLFTLVDEREQKPLIEFLRNPLYAGEKVNRYFLGLGLGFDLDVFLKPVTRKRGISSLLTK